MSFEMNRLPQKAVEDPEAEKGDNPENGNTDKKIAKGTEIHKKLEARFPGFRRNLYDYFVEYLNYTSIQGLRYIGERERSIFERLWWLALFCVSLYFGIYLIIQTWHKWETSPVIVSFATTPTPVWKVPFPAVTICSENKARRTVYNFTEHYNRLKDDPASMTDDELKKLSDASLVCRVNFGLKFNLTIGFDAIEFLKEIAPDSEDMLLFCQYPLLNETCPDMFTSIVTEEGICFTFNMLDRDELFRSNVYLPGDFMSHGTKSQGWTLREGYPKNTSTKTFPRRAMTAGFENRLVVELRTYQEDVDYICLGPVRGYKIIIHNPGEVPRPGFNYFRAPLNTETNLAIKPEMMTTSDGLRKYDPRRRQCYFEHERRLAFYKSYTQLNCVQECLTNYTRYKCGCVAHQMPREEETPLCGSGSSECILQARLELLDKEIQWEISHEESQVDDYSRCDCLPGCTTLVYNAETSQANTWKHLVTHTLGVHITRVNIFFKEHQFITSERNELYGQTDFLANCGGILGLFTGFSFLSLVEICYFLTFRLMCNVKRYGRHYWSGSQDLVNSDLYDHKK